MTTITAVEPITFREYHAPSKELEKAQNAAKTLRPKIEDFDIYEDYSPSKTCAAAVVDSAEDPLLDDWVETEVDFPNTLKLFDGKDPSLEQAFDALNTLARKRIADQIEPTQTNAEPASSWRSAFTIPMAGIYNAATGAAQVWTRNNAPESIRKFDASQQMERASELVCQIQEKLQRLDESICKANGNKVTPLDAGRIDPVRLSTWDSLQNFSARTQGAVTALLDTTVGVASGVAIGGVATTGILGLGFGAAALSGGAILALKEMRSLPERAESVGVRNVLDTRLPDIQKDLDELNAIISQEDHRRVISQRIMATIALRYDHCRALDQAIKGAEKALRTRIATVSELENGMAVPAAASRSSQPITPQLIAHGNDPTRNAVLAQLAQKRDALYNFIASLIQGFNTLSARLLLTPQAREVYANAKADKNAEEVFKTAYKTLLQDLSDFKNSTLAPGIDVIALQNLENSGTPTKVTDTALRADIAIGQNLTRTILSSGPNFGAVKYTARAGAQERSYAVPSNLTTVRSIARYIDAQAISNVRDLSAAAKAPALSQGHDGSYTIADPDRKLYSFLASAPTARANFSNPADLGSSAKLIDTGIGRMTVADYSSTFPGGANQMEFETKLDKNGASILTIRFSKQPEESLFRSEQTTALDIIKNQQKKLVTEQTPAKTSDFTGMSVAEIQAYLDNMTLLCDEQTTLLQEDRRQFDALNKWENPTFTRHA
ncbi:hypothetical protein [Bordetella genomosp. 4]|uniref:hypothetical protein n=1 Tax=Bordetella genomosp. 4 TaxID=463044 RepID=UPI000B9E6C9C|nr:hypothetical protein [Bordetella genomosp. 4]OZI43376.1 hypothetical protein CAL21_21620 [Bordetella genomosp. 4]